MSIYFFSEKEGEIKAFAGVKSLVLPHGIAAKIQSQVQHCLNQQDKNINSGYRDLLNQQIKSAELKEEYDHFQCLIHSKTASIFHIRNILVRMAFSVHTKHAIESNCTKSKKIIAKVIRYYMDYMLFYQDAYGLVEAHHILEQKMGEEDVGDRVIYSDRIRNAVNELKSIMKQDSTCNLNKIVAELVDHRFALRLGIRSQVVLCGEKTSVVRNVRLAVKLLYRDVLVISAWPLLLRLIIYNYKALWPYLLGRFISQNEEYNTTGNLPGILAADVTIDPVGFSQAKIALPGQDEPCKSVCDTILKNMLWHIISRVVVCAGLMRSGVKKVDILNYFKMLRKFNHQWSPLSKGADTEMSGIDNDAVIRLFSLRQSDKSPFSIEELQEVVLDMYLNWKTIPTINLESDSSPHMYAFNCSYMHV